MRHFGDITKIKGADVPPVEIITGGSPCQDLSVAGKRAGLAGERSGLFMEQIRIIKEMRENDRANGRSGIAIRPRYMVWENVPGAFSSNGGEDFRAVLEETARVADSSASIPRLPSGEGWSNSGAIVGDGWSIAWRVHDAQFWGVPQRRKRISLVADFAGSSALEILFEREGMSGDTQSGTEKGQGTARDAKDGSRETGERAISFQERAEKPGGGKGILIQDEHTGALSTVQNQSVCVTYRGDSITHPTNKSNPHPGDPCHTLTDDDRNYVVALEGNGMRASHHGAGYSEDGKMYTLNAVEQHVVYDGRGKGNGKVSPSLVGDHQRRITDFTAIVMDAYQHHGWRQSETVGTITARQSKGVGGDTPLVMDQAVFGQSSFGDFSTDFSPLRAQGGDYGGGSENLVVQGINGDKAGTLDASYYKGCGERQGTEGDVVAIECYNGTQGDVSMSITGAATDPHHVPCTYAQQSVVRRLTPLECERLQGYPSIREVRFTEMTKDEYIAYNLNEGHIIVDTEHGIVYGTRGPGGVALKEPVELKGTDVNGYKVVSIRNGETKMQCRVHRIVWIAKHGIIPEGYVIDHINNDKQDNRLCNLQLLTPGENSTKARKDGLYKVHDKSGSAKITDEVHDLIQYVYGNTDLTLRQLSEVFGISASRVCKIVHEQNWTDIGDWVDSKGKTHKGDSDSPRYKALGNSIALPFWQWMAERMVKALGVEHPTMASLFDGIGGFPLVFSRVGCHPVWASEIEEFPIAVTKKRFPEEDQI